MASKIVTCDPCSRLNKSSDGLKYCTDCEDALCTDCTALHSAVKLLASHHLVDVSVTTGNTFNIKKDCNDHEGMCFEFYCSDHDCLICRTCMANNHRTCSKIHPIDVAAKGCRSSIMLEDVTKDIASLLKSSKELVEERQKNKTCIEQSKVKVLKEITNFRQKINAYLDRLERKLSNEVNITERTISKKASNDLDDANKRQQVIQTFSQQVEFFSKYGSESQLFILLNTMKSDISRQAVSLQDLILSLETNDIGFEPTDLIFVIKAFGSIKVRSGLCAVEYQHPKHMQAQSQEVQQKVPTKFEFEMKVKIPSGRITCMVATNDNKLILCNDDIDTNNVSIWTETGHHLKSCTAAGRPFGIAIVPGTDEAVVTLKNISSIQFINITNVTPGRRIGTDLSSPYGVAVIRDSVYVGSNYGQVLIINRISGECLRKLKVGHGVITSIIPPDDNKAERLYVCEYNGDLVRCIKLDGTCIFSCVVNRPMTLALDTKRNSYVTGFDSNDLHRISPDGKEVNRILKETDGLNIPIAVAFNKTYSKMYISNSSDKNVMIFNCK